MEKQDYMPRIIDKKIEYHLKTFVQYVFKALNSAARPGLLLFIAEARYILVIYQETSITGNWLRWYHH